MIVFPNSKINLGLSILDKRADNFHEIETIFYPISLCDALEIIINPENQAIKFYSYGLEIPGDPKSNFCLKAYDLLKAEYALPGLKIGLIKKIPIGAGLGGGSSDAVFLLKSLNNQFNFKIEDSTISSLASKIGSDCNFFVYNKPALGRGRGDLLEPLNLDLSNYYIKLIHPGIHIGTAEAYSMVAPLKNRSSLLEIIKLPVPDWKGNLVNDFEKPIFKKYPEIEKIKEELYQKGALYSSMSGSGSSVYGIFIEDPSEIKIGQYFSWSGKLTN